MNFHLTTLVQGDVRARPSPSSPATWLRHQVLLLGLFLSPFVVTGLQRALRSLFPAPSPSSGSWKPFLPTVCWNAVWPALDLKLPFDINPISVLRLCAAPAFCQISSLHNIGNSGMGNPLAVFGQQAVMQMTHHYANDVHSFKRSV